MTIEQLRDALDRQRRFLGESDKREEAAKAEIRLEMQKLREDPNRDLDHLIELTDAYKAERVNGHYILVEIAKIKLEIHKLRGGE